MCVIISKLKPFLAIFDYLEVCFSVHMFYSSSPVHFKARMISLKHNLSLTHSLSQKLPPHTLLKLIQAHIGQDRYQKFPEKLPQTASFRNISPLILLARCKPERSTKLLSGGPCPQETSDGGSLLNSLLIKPPLCSLA
jgi:hypothetical protein